jgi:hypothetical protein
VMFPASRIVLADGWQVNRAEDGAQLCIHHPGLGWIGASISPADADGLEACITQPRQSERKGRSRRRVRQ